MSLPEGKAIYLIAFSSHLSEIRKLTDQPATHIAYCLFMLIICACICFFQILICIFALSLKTMFNLIFLSLWKSIICVLFSQRLIPTRTKPFLFLLMKFLILFLRIFTRIVFLLFLIVQPLNSIIMKSETKSKIWSAIIAAAVSLLTSIAQIFS